jgi:hypothetical protein
VVTLSGGRIVSDGPPHAREHVQGGVEGLAWELADLLPENEAVGVRRVTLATAATGAGTVLDLGIELEAKLAPQRCRPLLDVMVDRVPVLRSVHPAYCDVAAPGPLRFTVRIPAHALSARRYRLDLHVVSLVGSQVHAMKATGMVWLQVRRKGPAPTGQATGPMLLPVLPWEMGAIEAPACAATTETGSNAVSAVAAGELADDARP